MKVAIGNLLISFSRHPYLSQKRYKKPKAGEAPVTEKVQQQTGVVLPIKPRLLKQETVKLASIDNKYSAYATLRKARTDARLIGVRAKRKKEKDEKEASEAAKGK